MITDEQVERAAKILFFDTYQGKPKWGDEDSHGIQMPMLRKMYLNKARRVLMVALDENPVVGKQEGENDG